MTIRHRRFAIGFCVGVGFAYSAQGIGFLGFGVFAEAWAIVTVFPGFLICTPILDSVFDASPRDYVWLMFGVSAMVYGAVLGGAGYFSSLSSRRDLRGPAHLLRCKKCRYCLIGNTSGICPECGTRIASDGGGSNDGKR